MFWNILCSVNCWLLLFVCLQAYMTWDVLIAFASSIRVGGLRPRATVAMADVGSFLAVAEDLEVKGLSKEYMSDGTSDQIGHQIQPAGPASLSTFPPTAKLNQQQTSANNNIKAEEQLEQLGGLLESGQAEASQELGYDDYNQNEDNNQNEDYNQYQDDPYQVQCSKCIPEI